MIDVPVDMIRNRNAKCVLPIFSRLDPNSQVQNEYEKLNQLEKDKYTWILGTVFFNKYLTVFDERPVIEELKPQNYVGFTPCVSNIAHIDITDDDSEKAPPARSDNDTGPIPEDQLPIDDPTDEDEDGAGWSFGVVVLIVLGYAGLVFAAAIYLYLRKKRH